MLCHILLRKTYNPLTWECFKIVYPGTNTLNRLQACSVMFCGRRCAPPTFFSPLGPWYSCTPLFQRGAWLSDLLLSVKLCQSESLRELECKRATVASRGRMLCQPSSLNGDAKNQSPQAICYSSTL